MNRLLLAALLCVGCADPDANDGHDHRLVVAEGDREAFLHAYERIVATGARRSWAWGQAAELYGAPVPCPACDRDELLERAIRELAEEGGQP